MATPDRSLAVREGVVLTMRGSSIVLAVVLAALTLPAVPATAEATSCADGPAWRAGPDRPHVVDGRNDTNVPGPVAAAAPDTVGPFDVGRIWVSEPTAQAFVVNVELGSAAASASPGYSLVAYISDTQWVSARRGPHNWLFHWGNSAAGTVASGDTHIVRGTTWAHVGSDVLSLGLPAEVLPDLDGGEEVKLPRLLVATGTSVPLDSQQFLLRPVVDTSFNALTQCEVVLADPERDA